MEEAGISVLSIERGGLPIGILDLPLVPGRCGFELNYGMFWDTNFNPVPCACPKQSHSAVPHKTDRVSTRNLKMADLELFL